MKPTQTSDQKPRKLQTSNQLSVLLPLINEADTYRTNLTTIGKIEACSCNGGYCCTPFSYKRKISKNGDVPFSAVQTGKDSLQLRRITYTLPLYL